MLARNPCGIMLGEFLMDPGNERVRDSKCHFGRLSLPRFEIFAFRGFTHDRTPSLHSRIRLAYRSFPGPRLVNVVSTSGF